MIALRQSLLAAYQYYLQKCKKFYQLLIPFTFESTTFYELNIKWMFANPKWT